MGNKSAVRELINADVLPRFYSLLMNSLTLPYEKDLIMNTLINILATGSEFRGPVLKSNLLGYFLHEMEYVEGMVRSYDNLSWLLANLLRCEPYLTFEESIEYFLAMVEFFKCIRDEKLEDVNNFIWGVYSFLSGPDKPELRFAKVVELNLVKDILRYFEGFHDTSSDHVLIRLITRLAASGECRSYFTELTIEVGFVITATESVRIREVQRPRRLSRSSEMLCNHIRLAKVPRTGRVRIVHEPEHLSMVLGTAAPRDR